MKQPRMDQAHWLIFVALSMVAACALVGQTLLAKESQRSAETSQGVVIFRKSCAVCHSLSAGLVMSGPSLSGILRHHPSAASEERVRRIIAEGKDNMPAFKDRLSAEQISALIDFMKSSPTLAPAQKPAEAAEQVATGQSQLPWSTGAVSPRIEGLAKQVDAGNTRAVPEFWEELKSLHAPLMEPIPDDPNYRLVTFVYHGSPDTKSVVLYCQMMFSRDPSVNVLQRLRTTDLWFKTYSVRNDFRLSYSFVVDPGPDAFNQPHVGIPDPLNPKSAPETPYMGRSVLELPGAPPQRWASPRIDVKAGKIEELRIVSKILHSERIAWVYTPAGFDPSRPAPYPLLICFDGDAYASQDYMPVPTIIDNLLADKKIPPLIVLLVGQSPQPNRNIELSNNEPFLDFVADEMLPRIREGWHATSSSSETIVAGSSAGGLAASFFAFRRPGVFGNVLSQSGAFWPGKQRSDPQHEWLTRQFQSSPKLPIRFVLQVGLLEQIPTPGNGPSIFETNRHLRRVLENKGYEVHYREIAGGHEPLSWRGGFADGLMELMRHDDSKQSPSGLHK